VFLIQEGNRDSGDQFFCLDSKYIYYATRLNKFRDKKFYLRQSRGGIRVENSKKSDFLVFPGS